MVGKAFRTVPGKAIPISSIAYMSSVPSQLTEALRPTYYYLWIQSQSEDFTLSYSTGIYCIVLASHYSHHDANPKTTHFCGKQGAETKIPVPNL
jgi:hypothetical protein